MISQRQLILLAVTTVFSVATLSALSACNTVEGAGRDVKSAGSSVERKAQEEKAEHRAEERAERREEAAERR